VMTEEKEIEELRSFLIEEIKRIGNALSSIEEYDFLKDVEQLERSRTDFISRYRGIPFGCESFFVVLRKWNSYTPSLPAPTTKKEALFQHSIGGGYFLFIQGPEDEINPGYGLVIDPGYNFIHNFGLAGFCLDDIDGILITHAHNDHTNDFESLLSLLYLRNSNKYRGRRQNKRVDLFLNVGSFKKFSNYLDLANKDSRNYIGRVTVMSPGQTVRIPDRDELDCEIITLYTNHHEIVTADYSLGVCFKVAGRNLLLTGDTGWTFQTSSKNEVFLKENGVFTREENTAANVDILIAHIGTITRDEFNISTNGKNLESYYYDKHLGVLGTISAIEQWKPDLCVISEFGEELNAIRERLVHQIEETTRKIYPSIRCLPGDIGLFVFLDSRKSLCYLTGNLIEWDKIAYRDMEEGISQRSIKYCSQEMLSKLRDPEAMLKDLKINAGLKTFKATYLSNVVIPSFELRHGTKGGLMDDIGEITIDFSDALSVSEDRLKIVGHLIALSCIIDDPLDLIDLLLSGNVTPIEEIAAMLKAYHIDTKNLDDLSAICLLERFTDANRSVEEAALFEANKAFIKDFLLATKDGNDEVAKENLARIRNMSIADIWESLGEITKVDILIGNRGELGAVKLDDTKSKLGSYMKKVFVKKDYLEKEVQKAIMDEHMCWQGTSFPRTAEYFESILNEIEDVEKKAQVVKLIELSKEIEKSIGDTKDAENELKVFLKGLSYSVPESSDDLSSLFYTLNFALIEHSRGNLPATLILRLEEILR